MQRSFTVWLYIGALLSLYGLLLTSAGVYQVFHPPQTVLTEYHATFWVGLLLLCIGLIYVLAYWPRRRKDRTRDDGAEID